MAGTLPPLKMINLFKPDKKTLFLIAGLILLIIVLILIRINASNAPTAGPSPLPSVIKPTASPLPFSSVIQGDVYAPEKLEEDFKRLTAKKPLSASNAQIRSRLIQSLNNKSGYLKETANYRIEYVESPNLFMVEILSLNADAVKKEAVSWFYSQGLDIQGVCDLPVSFYLTSSVLRNFQENNIFFDPIPEGCQ